MRYFNPLILVACTLFVWSAPVVHAQDRVSIKYVGDYGYTTEKTWPDTKLGWVKNFNNGSPRENGVVQPNGYLDGEIYWPSKERKAIPFMIWMHGCSGPSNGTRQLMKNYADFLGKINVGLLVLDSFGSRKVTEACGFYTTHLQAAPNVYWAQRRAQDSYSALEFLVDKGFALSEHVYIAGHSNGAKTVLTTMEHSMKQFHKYRFAIGFATAPNCSGHGSSTFYAPVHVFVGSADAPNNPLSCSTMAQYDRTDTAEVKLHWYEGAYHGYQNEKGSKRGGRYEPNNLAYARDTREQIRAAILQDLGRTTP